MQVPFLHYRPALQAPSDLAPHAAVAGRATAGPGLVLRPYATLRADGESVRVGRNAHFGERASVHIAHGKLGTIVGDDVTVGRFGLVHACTLQDGVVVGDGATVMDGAKVGPYALIAAGAVVPPRKQLPGGYVYEGHPATPTREIGRDELAAIAHALRTGAPALLGTSHDLPPLEAAPFLPEGPFEGVLHAIHGAAPKLGRAYVAPTALVVGDVELHDDSGTYFGCVLAGGGARIVVGEASNVQDNSLVVTDAKRGDVLVGKRVTIGHNVRMGAGRFGDGALIGMSAKVADGVTVEPGGCIAAGAHVEPGTVVKAGWIWAGRPARAFRELKEQERAWFAEGVDVYVGYSRAYRGG
jgi:carbonic anhydrase/acetyltransferase-like protein (isoleucine patch superfamily)